LRGDQAAAGEVAADRGGGDGQVVVLAQVPGDRVGSVIVALFGQVPTQLDDQLDGVRW
jgi:hypothetical protein